MRKTVLVGTRASKLARWQSQWVINQLQGYYSDYRFQMVEIQTRGDMERLRPFQDIWEEGIFTKEIEEALEEEKIDMAVHSMRDLPYELSPDLTIAAVAGRSDPSDVLVSKGNSALFNLPQGAAVGTSSLLRRAQLMRFRQDLNIIECLGNIPTRLKKIDGGKLDAIVLSATGLERLGLEDRITEYLPYSLCMPAAGQGAVGVEIRRGNKEVQDMVERIHNPMAAAAVTAERSVVKRLGGHHGLPIGALARLKGKRLQLEAVVLSPGGSQSVRGYGTGLISDADNLGIMVAERLLMRGARNLLQKEGVTVN